MTEQSTVTKVEITRVKAPIAMMVPHTIFVDDHEVGQVQNGKTQTVEVSPGKHDIYVKQSLFVRSNSLTLECAPRETIRLQVVQNNALLQILIALTGIGLFYLSRRANLKLERLP